MSKRECLWAQIRAAACRHPGLGTPSIEQRPSDAIGVETTELTWIVVARVVTSFNRGLMLGGVAA